MINNIRYRLDNPHPFSQMKTELIGEGKYDEYDNRRTVDIAGCAMPLQKIDRIGYPSSRAQVQDSLFDLGNPTVQKKETYLLCVILQFEREIPQMPHSL